MEIEDKGELNAFQAMQTEATLYITVIRYSGGQWMTGPSNHDKIALLDELRRWNGITNARIYTVTVPVLALGV